MLLFKGLTAVQEQVVLFILCGTGIVGRGGRGGTLDDGPMKPSTTDVGGFITLLRFAIKYKILKTGLKNSSFWMVLAKMAAI